MRFTKSGVALAAVLAVLAPGVARAQGAPQTHDGFYLHLDLGIGGLSASSKDPQGIKSEAGGGGGEFSLALGGAVTPSFILAGRLWGASVTDPTVKYDGQKQEGVKGTLGLSGIGLDLTYYFMPINIYVTATPMITTVNTEFKSNGQTDKQTSKNGFGVRLAVGKEWWVSDNWGLGVELQLVGSSNKSKKTDTSPSEDTISSGWFGIAFGATYN